MSRREAGLCPPDMYPDWCTWYGGNSTQIAMYCVDLTAFDVGAESGQWLEDVRTSKWQLAAVPAIAIISGFLFLGFVYRFGAVCIWLALAIAAVLPVGLGLLLFQHASEATTPGSEREVPDLDKLSPDTQKQVAYGLWALGGVVVLLACCFARTIHGVVAVLRATSQFLEDVPSQMVQPLLLGVAQLTVFGLWLAALVQVASIGVSEGNARECLALGDIYCLEWKSDSQRYALAFILFMLYWVLNFLHALSHFGTSYAVAEWYFASTDPLTGRRVGGHGPCDCRLSLRACCRGLVSHPGSLAFGAFVISLARIARMLIWWAAKDEEARPHNPVVKCLRGCVNCLADCFTRWIEFVSEHAYVEIALTGQGFCPAARKAASLSVLRPGLFLLVGRVACSVKLIGTLLIVACTTFAVGLLLSVWPPDGLHAATVPLTITAVAAFVVGGVMMHPFSAAARAALHCYCLEEEQANSQGTSMAYTPQPMLRLVEEYSGEGPETRAARCCPCF